MKDIDEFIEFVSEICSRPRRYVARGSYFEVCAFLSGYSLAFDTPIGSRAFSRFVCAKIGFPDKYFWPAALHSCSRDDQHALARLQYLLIEFLELSKTIPPQQIADEALRIAKSIPETEPIKVWRQFARNLLRGEREYIEPLILSHPDADALWSGSCRPHVAPLLDQIRDSFVVSQISGSEDEGHVTIITPDCGNVEIKQIDGSWRVDASRIIERRKKRLETRSNS